MASLIESVESIRNKKSKSLEMVEDLLKIIEEKDKKLKAFIHVNDAEAKARATAIDDKQEKGEVLGKLAGVPVAIKDNLCTLGIPTTCASKILGEYNPIYNATVVKRILDEDGVILGKTNMDEFAMGSTTENSGKFPTLNPIDPERIPGGSSGGSAAAVKAGEAIIALGSDTGGSIRQPAACCGVVGLKPTYGRVSRFGLVAFASSLDQIGTLSQTVDDAALMLSVISGRDQMDSTSAAEPVPDFVKSLQGNIKGLKLGMPKEYFAEGLDAEVKKGILEGIEKLKSHGANIIDVSLPHVKYAVSTYYIIATAEASANLSRFDGVKYGARSKGATLDEMYYNTRAEGFGPEVKRRIMLGTYVLSSGYYDAYYHKAQKVRTLISQDFQKAFQYCDAIVAPTMPTLPYKIGEKISDPLAMYLSDIYTISVNLAGLPGISVPVAESRGLPIGLQVISKSFDEVTMLKIAKIAQS